MNKLNFNEEQYLNQNLDVYDAVKKGDFKNGLEHYEKFGKQEGRTLNFSNYCNFPIAHINSEIADIHTSTTKPNPIIFIDRPSSTLISNFNINIFGWIAVDDPLELQEIEFEIDNKLYDPTYFERNDLNNVSDLHKIKKGWVINTKLVQNKSKIIKIKILKKKLIFQKTYLKGVALLQKEYRSPIYFMHIPKTAGTSFREFFDYIYKDNSVLYIYNDFPGVNAEAVQNLENIYIQSREAVFGHFATNLKIDNSYCSKYFTVLRDPAHLINSYNSFITHPDSEFFDNPLVRHISGIGYSVPFGSIDKTHLDAAIKALENNVYAIDMNHMQDFADEFTELLNMPKFQISTLNSRPHKNPPLKSVDFDIKFDNMLYDYFLKNKNYHKNIEAFLMK